MDEQRTVFRVAFPPITDSSENIVRTFNTWVLIRNILIGFTLVPGGRMTVGLGSADLIRVTNPSSATENLDSYVNADVYQWFGFDDELRLTVAGGNATGLVSGDQITRHTG